MRLMKMLAALALSLALAPATAHAEEWGRDFDEEGQEVSVSAEYLMFNGVVESDGMTFTWYSENVLPGYGLTELNENGRTVDENGYVVDGEGYIALASPDWEEPIGTVVETPFGIGKVYDYCGTEAYDVYTSW